MLLLGNSHCLASSAPCPARLCSCSEFGTSHTDLAGLYIHRRRQQLDPSDKVPRLGNCSCTTWKQFLQYTPMGLSSVKLPFRSAGL